MPTGGTAGDVRAATRRSGHLRILTRDGERIAGVVHVRDTLAAPDDAPVSGFARPVFGLEAKWIPAELRAQAEISGITVVDRAGVITYQTPSIGWVLGHPPDRLLHTDVAGLVHPDDADQRDPSAERNQVVRHVCRAAEPDVLGLEADDRHRRLRADA